MIVPVVFGEKYVVVCDYCNKRSHTGQLKGFSSYDEALEWMKKSKWETKKEKGINLDLCSVCKSY